MVRDHVEVIMKVVLSPCSLEKWVLKVMSNKLTIYIGDSFLNTVK